MTVDAGHDGGCLNFVAEIQRMPECLWQCLDFRGTGQICRKRQVGDMLFEKPSFLMRTYIRGG